MTAPPRRARSRGARLVVLIVLGGLLLTMTPVAPASPAHAASPINGAGSTFAQIAIDQWRADVARSQGLQINYSGQGSSQGRRLFAVGQVDWASSDISYEPEELPVPRQFTYAPLVAGGTGLMYNLRDSAGNQITNLRLSGDTIARIFTGEVRRWNDSSIVGDNPQLGGRLPAQDIKPVVRSGGSGTSAVFTGYIAKIAPGIWSSFASRYGIPRDFTSNFPDVPGFIKQSGSDGIANFVANPNAGAGSIGYAEAGYALQRGLPMASVRNQAGQWTQPTPRAVATALLNATRNPDGTQNLDQVYFHPSPDAYAISSYNYIIVPTAGIDPGKGETIGRFLSYSVTEGQTKAAPLGYSPLPPNLIAQALDVVRQIPGAPPPPDACAYANIYAELGIPGGPTNCASALGGGPGGGPGAAGPGVAGPGAGAGADGPTAEELAALAAAAAAGEDAEAAGEDEEASASRSRFGLDEEGNLIALGADGEDSPFNRIANAGFLVLLVVAAGILALVYGPPIFSSATEGMRTRIRRTDR